MDKTSTDLELALRLVKNGDDESATQVFNKILKENEKEPVALEFFAVKEIKAKNYKNAIHLLKQALRSNECRASVLFQMGHALRDSGNISKAEQFYSRYYSITNDYKAAITYADVLIKLSKSNEAIHILNQIDYPDF